MRYTKYRLDISSYRYIDPPLLTAIATYPGTGCGHCCVIGYLLTFLNLNHLRYNVLYYKVSKCHICTV
jgi:hypothetical protein